MEWQHPSGSDLDAYATTLLDAASFETSLQYDALNRVKHMRYPEDVDGERKELLPEYNRAGALESVTMDGDNYVQHIAYSAKGQRILIAYGNGVMTRYAYDPLTFRLLRMRTGRFTQPDALTYHPQGQALQDMRYEYDLHGNMLSLHDRAVGSGIAPQPDLLDREFTYDPIYRLLTATGRECDLPASTSPWQDTPRCTDITRTRAYMERYQYDAVGNMEQLRHHNNGAGFTRDFTLTAGTNQLDTLQIGGTTYQYQYDSNGNLIQENASRIFEWDHNDRLRSFRTQAGNSEPSVYTHYLYDAAGQRVKKVTRKSGVRMNSTVYIDDMFEYHRERSGGTTRNNNHLHIMDNEKRIAIRRIGNPFPGDAGSAIQYHLGDHLGSSHLVINETGAWINREDFTPFGETSFGSFAKKRYRFTGKERDEHSGLYYHGARYYAPWLARWVSCDPVLLNESFDDYQNYHPFLYVEDRPLVAIDPNGEFLFFLAAAVIVAIVLEPQIANAPAPRERTIPRRSTTDIVLSGTSKGLLVAGGVGLVRGGAQVIAREGLRRGGTMIARDLAVGEARGRVVQQAANTIDPTGTLGQVTAILPGGRRRRTSRRTTPGTSSPSRTPRRRASTGGRGSNQFRGPDPSAEGRPHSRFRTDEGGVSHYETYNYPAPGQGKRVDVVGSPHGGVPTPHVVETTRHVNPRDPSRSRYVESRPRPAQSDEIPIRR